MVMEYLQAGIVGDESPFLCLIRLSAVHILRHVEVAFIPLDDFIIRAVCLSGSDVLLHLFSQRISAKPAVMYLLRNHCILSPLIYILISIFILQIVPLQLTRNSFNRARCQSLTLLPVSSSSAIPSAIAMMTGRFAR